MQDMKVKKLLQEAKKATRRLKHGSSHRAKEVEGYILKRLEEKGAPESLHRALERLRAAMAIAILRAESSDGLKGYTAQFVHLSGTTGGGDAV